MLRIRLEVLDGAAKVPEEQSRPWRTGALPCHRPSRVVGLPSAPYRGAPASDRGARPRKQSRPRPPLRPRKRPSFRVHSFPTPLFKVAASPGNTAVRQVRSPVGSSAASVERVSDDHPPGSGLYDHGLVNRARRLGHNCALVFQRRAATRAASCQCGEGAKKSGE